MFLFFYIYNKVILAEVQLFLRIVELLKRKKSEYGGLTCQPLLTQVMLGSSDCIFLFSHFHREIDGANYIVFCRSLLRLIQVITLPVLKSQKGGEGGEGGVRGVFPRT